LPPVSTTPAANFATSFTSVVDTGGAWGKQIHEKSRKSRGTVPLSIRRKIKSLFESRDQQENIAFLKVN
jgi:hypothetical protein